MTSTPAAATTLQPTQKPALGGGAIAPYLQAACLFVPKKGNEKKDDKPS